MNSAVKKIAILGPESSGKTELCIHLAKHFKTVYAPEFARNYLVSINRPYTSDDLLFIAKMQLREEEKAVSKANTLVFLDTELINLKQWCLHRFGFCHPLIEEELSKKPYDFYLLTSPDLPWISDPLRENPGKGDYFFEVYKKEIEHYGFSFAVVNGKGKRRTASAVIAVERFLNIN